MSSTESAARQKRREKARRKAREWVRDYIKHNPCVDCGETDWRVIEFDHKDRALKKANIANLITQGCSLEAVKQEVAKCEPRCANCHRRKTIKQLNWYRT